MTTIFTNLLCDSCLGTRQGLIYTRTVSKIHKLWQWIIFSILAHLLAECGFADGQEVRPQSSNGELGDVSKESVGNGTKDTITTNSVNLNQ